MKRHVCRVFAPCALLAAIGPALGTDPGLAFEPGAEVKIAHSAGKFDFLQVDTQRHRLLASHEKDKTVDVIDLRSRRVLKRVKLGGAVDTLPDPGSRHYYVSVQDPGFVAVLDAATLKQVTFIKTAGPTDAMIYEPRNHHLYVTRDDGSEVWVIDPGEGKVIGSIAVPGAPEYMVFDPSTGRIYLNIKSKDLVAVIDPATSKVVQRWSTAPAHAPHGLALDEAHHRIYSAGDNGKLVAIDTRSGARLGSVDIVDKVDQIAFDPAKELIYCAGPDKISVVRGGEKLVPAGSIATAATAKNVAIDPATHEVWTTYTDGTDSFAKSWRPRRQ
jgi:DNA-binding beta-propeller fold protein YncE